MNFDDDMDVEDSEIMNGAWHELPPTIEAFAINNGEKSDDKKCCLKTILGLIFLLLIIWFLYHIFSCPYIISAPSDRIDGIPEKFYPNVEYVISSEHMDCYGKDEITLCQLKLIHPYETLILSWDMEDPQKIVYKNLSNKYIRIKKIEYKVIRNGYRVYWHFVLKPDWDESNNIDFSANVKDKHGREYGWNDVLDSNVSFIKNN